MSNEEIQSILLDPSNEPYVGSIVRAAKYTMPPATCNHEVKVENMTLPVGSLFGCLAVCPFADLVFDAGRIQTEPLQRKSMYDQNFDTVQIATTLHDSIPNREVLEDGSIEVTGVVRLRIQSARSRRRNPFPMGMDLANRSAGMIGQDKAEEMDWDYTQNYRYRAVYRFSDGPGTFTIGSGYDRENLTNCSEIEEMRTNQSFGNTRINDGSVTSTSAKRTMHEPSSVGHVLWDILQHKCYRTLTPKYDILHRVTDTQMWFKSMIQTTSGFYACTSVEMALVKCDLPISDGPHEGLEFIDMNLTSDLQRKGEDVTHWTNQEDDKNFGQGLDIDFTDHEACEAEQLLNFRPHDLTKENLVNVEDNQDTLEGFVRINQDGHVFLTIPFEIEIAREKRVYFIEKGGYRVRIHGQPHGNILQIHGLILESLRTVAFTPVSDRIKSLGYLTGQTGDNSITKADKIDSRITELSDVLSEHSFSDEDRYIP